MVWLLLLIWLAPALLVGLYSLSVRGGDGTSAPQERSASVETPAGPPPGAE